MLYNSVSWLFHVAAITRDKQAGVGGQGEETGEKSQG